MTTDLIKRLTEATEGSRELDLAIHIELYPNSDVANAVTNYKHGRFDGTEGYYWNWWGAGDNFCVERRTADGGCPFNGSYPLPHYTTSLDAAMTLVPEGYRWLVRSGDKDSDRDTRPFAHVNKLDKYNEGESYPAYAATDPIALCISALKAKDQS